MFPDNESPFHVFVASPRGALGLDFQVVEGSHERAETEARGSRGGVPGTPPVGRHQDRLPGLAETVQSGAESQVGRGLGLSDKMTTLGVGFGWRVEVTPLTPPHSPWLVTSYADYYGFK